MKKLKIFLVIALVLILGAGGYLLYVMKFKEYDVADEEVKEIVADPYKVELPDGSTLIIDESGEVMEEPSATGTTGTNEPGKTSETKEAQTVSTNESSTKVDSKETTDEKNSGNESKNNTTQVTSESKGNTKPSVDTITEKYRPALEGLETQADAKINALIGRALNEYNDKRSNGEKVDFGYFYNKYMSAANSLEANTDTVFYSVVKVIEKDLAANGLDKASVETIKEEYEATKKARRDNLLKKALNR